MVFMWLVKNSALFNALMSIMVIRQGRCSMA
nr:MAG TPA: hypothetical protein [Caudoviricetes sp.]